MVELSSLVTVTLVGLPLDVLVVDDPSKIVFEFTPPALEYAEGRNTKEHTNNGKSNPAADVERAADRERDDEGPAPTGRERARRHARQRLEALRSQGERR